MENITNSANNSNDMVNNPDPARLIHGLRDTGYDFYTAAADIIDNSVAAGATNIHIQVELTSDGRKFVYFGDDGHGMNHTGLRNAMRYGAPIRGELASLGKFGLGLKTASSSICLKYSVITRNDRNAPLEKLTWDLEHVADINQWEMLKEEITEDEIELYEKMCGDVGTLVVWARCDRLLSKTYSEAGGSKEKSAINNRVDKLINHCALIFHKYLNHGEPAFKNVNIFVNDEVVKHWNPFYPERSEQVIPPKRTELPIELKDGSIHNAIVKAWILPHSKDMTKEEGKEYAKISNRGQGFYIHREGRVIHYGGYLGIWRADDPHWSLLRIEFDFGHELDEAFSVDVKKSRILLDPALEDALKAHLTPAYNEADNRYRRKQVTEIAGGITHDDSNKTIGETKGIDKVTVENVNMEAGEATVSNNIGSGIKIITPIESNVEPANLYVNAVETISSGALWEPCLTSSGSSNHSTGVHLNKYHEFYTKIYSQANSSLSLEGLDLILWALAAAEHKNTDPELKIMWEDIRDEVSSNLKKLLRSIDIPSS